MKSELRFAPCIRHRFFQKQITHKITHFFRKYVRFCKFPSNCTAVKRNVVRKKPSKKAIRLKSEQPFAIEMVELRGVEPLSERRPTKASPSAVCNLDLAPAAATNSLRLCQAFNLPPLVKPSQRRQAHINDPSRILWAGCGRG